MKIEIQIDEDYQDPLIKIYTSKMSDEINDIIKILNNVPNTIIAGYKDDQVKLLDINQIDRIYALNGKVYAQINSEEYIVKLRLYEIEQRLITNYFVRISNSEIINLKKVKSFDLSFTGTICVTLSNKTITYVSRRYVSKIKQILGI